MSDLVAIRDCNKLRKYDQMVEQLKQDNGYWFKNDIWDLNNEVFKNYELGFKNKARLKKFRFDYVDNINLKNEIKCYMLYRLKNKIFNLDTATEKISAIKYLVEYINIFIPNTESFQDISIDPYKIKMYMFSRGIKLNKNNEISDPYYRSIYESLTGFVKDFSDCKEETEKDVWDFNRIKGARVPASGVKLKSTSTMNFLRIPIYYRETVKKYMRTIVTKKACSTCFNIFQVIGKFFDIFYEDLKYTDGFLENLTRDDIEKYLYIVNQKRKTNNITYLSKYVSEIRTFLEYIQLAQYDKAPKKEAQLLIFEMDIPTRERDYDRLQRIKFIPEPVLKQLDSSIMELSKPEYIPVYILLRETGWRGTDVLNLRYNNCLEKVWNKKEDKYNCYLCGEITKTGIAQLKIPIRDKVAEMVERCMNEAKQKSNEDNNPQKYLFNIYEGRRKGTPYNKQVMLGTIKKLITNKDIRNENGDLFQFKMHSLRHTRAKEYVEQGMGISIIQQILGHRSLQMTVHYATVTENALYEKWKQTEELDLFRVDLSNNEIKQVALNTKDGEDLIRYEYVKKNLDAVRVPFGVCFKPSKLPCKQQMNHCLTCASFCTTIENIPEYEEEIEKVKNQIEISGRYGRELWAEKNRAYLRLLEELLDRVKQQKIVHKNAASREDVVNG